MLTNPLHLIKGIVGRTFYAIPRRPERIQIEITNRCNYTCGMCPRESFNLPEQDISLDLFKKIIDRTDSIYNITLTGWGEPLLHPELVDMILYTKNKGHHVGVTTNGLLLASFIEKFLETLDKLTISLDSVKEGHGVTDGHPSNMVVQKNIESLLHDRGNRRKPTVTIQITMHDKSQCLDTIRFAGEVGADRVYLVRLNNQLGNSGCKRPSLKEELTIYKMAEEIAEKYGLQVDNNYTAFENRLLRLFYKQLRPVMYQFDKYCPKPYDYLYINIDGKATPCCDLPRYEVGNLLKRDIDEIWHGENIHYFREHQNDVCGNCDALRLKHLY
ncbi:MAG: hypothetical protein B6D35_00790 [Candidatus Brocadia sp. UTAMX2]|jgi:MoaA/NifB/PqqE/SkfB family radical SAM enzyme|nr:MAG: hypothetical protein B6D35_00790 [Candidatus Brocadia sp. UTAMX2]